MGNERRSARHDAPRDDREPAPAKRQCEAVRQPALVHGIPGRLHHHRNHRWRNRARTLEPTRIIRRARHEHTLGPAAPCLLQWVRHVDLPDDTIFHGDAGFNVAEISPWQEGPEAWRGLRVEFAYHIASHSRFQDFYFVDDGLLRRHDYHVDVAGGFAAAQYVSEYVEAQGFRFPSRRRAYLRGEDRQPLRERVMVSIDLSDFRLS